MKVKILEVLWHDKAPVHSVDMDATGRLATAGSDNNVRLWRLVFGGQGEGSTGSSQTHVADAIEVEFLATLNRHQAPVNVVRFSPNGQRLASAGDDGLVLLWKFINAEPKKATLGDEDEGGKETWGIDKTLRGGAAGSDIYDITWSSDGAFLAAASIDHTVRVFDVLKGTSIHTIDEHTHYVQGVAWDPRSRLLASQSSDRTCRIYKTEWNGKVLSVQPHAKLYRAAVLDQSAPTVATSSDELTATLPAPAASDPPAATAASSSSAESLLFQDESLASFFRRLAFSPDGNLLVVPAGQVRQGSNAYVNTVYVYSRNQFNRPLYHLPGHKKASVVVRFSPVLYALREGCPSLLSLPYAMVFAVATQDTVLVYSTQQPEPIALASNLHYSSITDVTWSQDGLTLVVPSRDGFCSILRFAPDELGSKYADSDAVLSSSRASLKRAYDNEPPAVVAVAAAAGTPDATPTLGPSSVAEPTINPSPDDSSKKAKRRIALQVVE